MPSQVRISTIGILLYMIGALPLFNNNVCKHFPGKEDEKIEKVSCRVKIGFVKTQKIIEFSEILRNFQQKSSKNRLKRGTREFH